MILDSVKRLDELNRPDIQLSILKILSGAKALGISDIQGQFNFGEEQEQPVQPDYDKALEEYQRATTADFTFYEAYNNLSGLYILRRRDYGAALRLLDRAMNLNAQEPTVRYSLHKNCGWPDLELRNYLTAEQHLRLASELEPDRGAARCLLAKVLEAEGSITDADPEWESCLSY